MSSRKKSTSTEESSSGSTSDSSTSSGSTSGSDSGSSSSESDSSSSPDEKSTTAVVNSRSNDQSGNNTSAGGNNNSVSNSKTNTLSERTARRKSSEIKQSKPDDKISAIVKSNKAPVNRGQRLSKSSIYSSDEEIPTKKQPPTKTQPSIDRKKSTETKKTNQPPPQPQITGGKAPPSVVKQQQQQNFVKNAANRQNILKTQQKSQPLALDKAKKKSIFSPDNSSDSNDNDKQKVPKPVSAPKAKQPPKPKPRAVPQKKAAPVKKEDSKSTASSASTSSSDATTTSSDSDDSDSSDGDSSPPSKRPPPKRMLSKNSGKSESKTVMVSDSDIEHSKAPTVRKLTRSSSTRKSKHLTGKATDSDSDMDTDKRSISKSPVKKASAITTKSKTKAKRGELKMTTPLPLATPPIPEEQKCPVEGCDSSGHLSGNLEKHFLPEACPMYHNMSVSEAKERANERKIHEEERRKAIDQYDPTRKLPTPEQKTYQMKIRESRIKFKPMQTLSGEKIKIEKQNDTDREPNLCGLVPDYDLQLFREAQAIASEQMENELKDLPVGKGTKYITMGKYQMKVWYQSPYPDDAARLPRMYICEFCLRYQKSEVGMKRHAAKCVWRHPPGDEIYRKGKLQVWQVDGKRHKQYCQHLCLLAKFFLDHKTLYYDVEPFLFYVMTLADSEGCHTVGYFSKEKNSFLNYNVSCILTLPPYQRKGYGRLLIDFSYLLTRVENKIGSPEKPLSDLGLISYRSYWKDVLLDYLCTRTGTTLSIKDVSQEMAISSYDIVSTLQALGMMKYWKGKHIILKKQDVLEEFEERVKRRGNFPKIDRLCLRWTPFVPPQASGSS